MNTTNGETMGKASATQLAEQEKEDNAPVSRSIKYSIYPTATWSGLTAGLFMGLYLIFLQIAGFEDTIVLKFLKYIILIGILGWGLNRYRQINTGNSFFPNGILLGMLTTFISAATLIVINILISLIMPEWAFNKFNLAINSPGSFLVTSGAIFFEIIVFGLISTFIWLQYLKGRGVR